MGAQMPQSHLTRCLALGSYELGSFFYSFDQSWRLQCVYLFGAIFDITTTCNSSILCYFHRTRSSFVYESTWHSQIVVIDEVFIGLRSDRVFNLIIWLIFIWPVNLGKDGHLSRVDWIDVKCAATMRVTSNSTNFFHRTVAIRQWCHLCWLERIVDRSNGVDSILFEWVSNHILRLSRLSIRYIQQLIAH